MSEETTEQVAPVVPVLQVTRGSASAEEVAALTVLFAAMGGGAAKAEANLRRGWSRPARRLNTGLMPGGNWGRA